MAVGTNDPQLAHKLNAAQRKLRSAYQRMVDALDDIRSVERYIQAHDLDGALSTADGSTLLTDDPASMTVAELGRARSLANDIEANFVDGSITEQLTVSERNETANRFRA